MARNRRFRRRYQIEVAGTTTNNFMIKFLDRAFIGFVRQLVTNFKTLRIISFEVMDDTQIKLRTIYTCPKCGAHKHTEGSTCLLCAFEEEQK